MAAHTLAGIFAQEFHRTRHQQADQPDHRSAPQRIKFRRNFGGQLHAHQTGRQQHDPPGQPQQPLVGKHRIEPEQKQPHHDQQKGHGIDHGIAEKLVEAHIGVDDLLRADRNLRHRNHHMAGRVTHSQDIGSAVEQGIIEQGRIGLQAVDFDILVGGRVAIQHMAVE